MDKSNASELEMFFQKTPKREDPDDFNPLDSELRPIRESRDSFEIEKKDQDTNATLEGRDLLQKHTANIERLAQSFGIDLLDNSKLKEAQTDS